jgi:hypothetical protein
MTDSNLQQLNRIRTSHATKALKALKAQTDDNFSSPVAPQKTFRVAH